MKPLDWSKPETLRFENSKDEILEVLIFKHEEITHPVMVAYRSHDRNVYFKNFTLDGFYYEDRRESPFNIVQIIRKPMTFKQFVHLLIDFGTLIQIKHKNGTTEAFQVESVNIFQMTFTALSEPKNHTWFVYDRHFVNYYIYSIDGGKTYQNFYTEEKL